MQTFSSMQRNSFYKTNIKYLLFFVFCIFYESLSSIYIYLTPLFGVMFYYLLTNIKNQEKYFQIFLVFLYILIFEVDKGFIPFSFLLFFLFYYFFIFERIEHFFNKKISKIFFHIINAYIGYYLTNFFLDYLFGYAILNINFFYLLYIFVDTLIAVVLFA